jgi:1-deoxy-D-xylulose-5-phosphate reductoisomerase
MKNVAVLGATGSIGASALAVLAQHRDRFRPFALTANSNVAALERLVEQWRPEIAVVADSPELPARSTGGTTWLYGRRALLEVAGDGRNDIVLNALVGAAGLEPTLRALKAGSRVALANKESLVCGGELVLRAVEEGGGELIPVDSEHSAIHQCLRGGRSQEVERLILTASGGPFRGLSAAEIQRVKPVDALRHPTWEMGSKVTIDSATLANKALEVIEAHFLFRIGYDRIDAVVHPQSIVHSMVEFLDGSVLAQMGFPTMELPIVHALGFPERLPYRARRFDPVAAGQLTFEAVARERFPAFDLGVEAGRAGGGAPVVYNAANEVAVAAFLNERIGFTAIPETIADTLDGWGGGSIDTVEDVAEVDQWARRTAQTFIDGHVHC